VESGISLGQKYVTFDGCLMKPNDAKSYAIKIYVISGLRVKKIEFKTI